MRKRTKLSHPVTVTDARAQSLTGSSGYFNRERRRAAVQRLEFRKIKTIEERCLRQRQDDGRHHRHDVDFIVLQHAEELFQIESRQSHDGRAGSQPEIDYGMKPIDVITRHDTKKSVAA